MVSKAKVVMVLRLDHARPCNRVVSNIIFHVLFISFSYSGTYYKRLSLFPTCFLLFRDVIKIHTFVFALTHCAFVSYTCFTERRFVNCVLFINLLLHKKSLTPSHCVSVTKESDERNLNPPRNPFYIKKMTSQNTKRKLNY